jgi:hypothetical protein
MPITPVPIPVRRVHVYELCNRTRLESLLVVTTMGGEAALALLRRQPPPEASTWDPVGDELAVEALATQIAEAAAEEFLTLYLDRTARRTWRFRVWRP